MGQLQSDQAESAGREDSDNNMSQRFEFVIRYVQGKNRYRDATWRGLRRQAKARQTKVIAKANQATDKRRT